MRYILILTIIVLSSCSPIKKHLTCEERFYRILKSNTGKPKPFQITGTIFTGGVFFLFTGRFEKSKDLSIFTPLGQKVATVRYISEERLCISHDGIEECDSNINILSKYINSDIPFNLENLLTGRFFIPRESVYRCEKDYIIINTGRYIIKYRNIKPETITFKNFSVLYRYESGKIKSIFILKNGKEIIKIFVKRVKWL
ncbi:hypothetical protein [Persephonella sp.]